MTRARLSAQRTRREALEARTARVVAQTRVGSARVVSSTVVPTPAALAQTLPAEGAQAAAAVLRARPSSALPEAILLSDAPRPPPSATACSVDAGLPAARRRPASALPQHLYRQAAEQVAAEKAQTPRRPWSARAECLASPLAQPKLQPPAQQQQQQQEDLLAEPTDLCDVAEADPLLLDDDFIIEEDSADMIVAAMEDACFSGRGDTGRPSFNIAAAGVATGEQQSESAVLAPSGKLAAELARPLRLPPQWRAPRASSGSESSSDGE